MQVQHHTQAINGISLHYVEAGRGPLLVLCHGFPESWYSWRHQIEPLVKAGYRVVVPDMRGYGGSEKPASVDAYSVSALVGDLVGLVLACGEKQAALVAHDWGGMVAWYAALMRPDMFVAAAVMGAPYTPPMTLPAGLTLLDAVRMQAAPSQNYRVEFARGQDIAHLLDADIRKSLLGMLYTFSGNIIRDDVKTEAWSGNYPANETFTGQLSVPETLPSWLTEEDLNQYVSDMQQGGFTPGLNWYRNIDRLPEILAPFIGKKIEQPALYLYGEYDRVSGNSESDLSALRGQVPGLTQTVMLPGQGHWLQQEAPDEVNRLVLAFLNASYPAKRSTPTA